MNINENLRKTIFEKAGMPKNIPNIDYSITSELLSKIKYAKGIIFAVQKIHDKQ